MLALPCHSQGACPPPGMLLTMAGQQKTGLLHSCPLTIQRLRAGSLDPCLVTTGLQWRAGSLDPCLITPVTTALQRRAIPFDPLPVNGRAVPGGRLQCGQPARPVMGWRQVTGPVITSLLSIGPHEKDGRRKRTPCLSCYSCVSQPPAMQFPQRPTTLTSDHSCTACSPAIKTRLALRLIISHRTKV